MKKLNNTVCDIVNAEKIERILRESLKPYDNAAPKVLEKARLKKGLNLEETAILLNSEGREFRKELFNAAAEIKKEIYGERIVFFAPIYISDFCSNDCEYCNFHKRNENLRRKKLSLDEIARQTEILIASGHKRLLLEAGESEECLVDYITEAIKVIYSVDKDGNGIRRVNVNIAATTVENYRKLKKSGIGTYQLFQETYHRGTYARLHSGPKANYERQITAHDRAFEAGIDDVGLGVLFGLYDWRFEVLSLVEHASYLEKRFGVGPHTISVPRFKSANVSPFSPQEPVSDDDFLKIIAVLRLAVPYTGMIISTRENPWIRMKAFHIGISQASAGSVTSVGGYGKSGGEPQFSVSDNRTLSSVVDDIIEQGLLPSFCTACYRSGRTGRDFMTLAKPGEIHEYCRPNGLLTFAEYLEDFSRRETYEKGYKLIGLYLNQIKNASLKKETEKKLKDIKDGKRDEFF